MGRGRIDGSRGLRWLRSCQATTPIRWECDYCAICEIIPGHSRAIAEDPPGILAATLMQPNKARYVSEPARRRPCDTRHETSLQKANLPNPCLIQTLTLTPAGNGAVLARWRKYPNSCQAGELTLTR
jgi:hypothetical protein